MIVDREDGRIPELTPLGKKQREQLTAEAAARRVGPYVLYNHWSDLPTYTQCISRPMPRIERLWDGDSRGHWEGNTLVVDWTNFDPRQEARVGGARQGNVHYIERFTRVDAKTVNEVVTVDDPATWTKTWTYVLPWRADDPNYQHPEDLYEYACHESNYRQMENALAGSRAIKAAAKSAKKESN